MPPQMTIVRALSKRGRPTWHNASDVKLRNAHLAVIDRSKVLDYLLNEAHPDNGGKARFFGLIGYSREDPERLIQALRDVAEQGEVISSGESVHGEKYVVDGWLSVHTQESRRWSNQDGLDHRPWERCTAARHRVSWQGVTIRDDQGTRSHRPDEARTL